MSNAKSEFKYHPIQLRDVKVLNLSISTDLTFDSESPVVESTDSNFEFLHTHSDYDEDQKMFFVKIKAKMGGEEESTSLFKLEVELLGAFDVDEENFPMKYIGDFAEKNAPLLLYPYLREHVYSLTAKAGVTASILPLFEVPAFSLKRDL